MHSIFGWSTEFHSERKHLSSFQARFVAQFLNPKGIVSLARNGFNSTTPEDKWTGGDGSFISTRFIIRSRAG